MILALFFSWHPSVDIDDNSVNVASSFHIAIFQLEAVVLVTCEQCIIQPAMLRMN